MRRDVAELGQGDQGDQFPDPVLGHQRLAAGLVAGDPAQPEFQFVDSGVERVDHEQRDLDPL